MALYYPPNDRITLSDTMLNALHSPAGGLEGRAQTSGAFQPAIRENVSELRACLRRRTAKRAKLPRDDGAAEMHNCPSNRFDRIISVSNRVANCADRPDGYSASPIPPDRPFDWLRKRPDTGRYLDRRYPEPAKRFSSEQELRIPTCREMFGARTASLLPMVV